MGTARLDAATPTRRSRYPAPHCARTCSSAGGHGISTVCPSPAPFGLGLGPTDPPWMSLAAEPLAIRGEGLSTFLALLMPAFALVRPPARFPPGLRGCARRSPTTPSDDGIRGFGGALSPDHCRRGCTRPVSCYALFQGWLLLSQPPGCLCPPTSLATQRALGGLSRRSGLLPFWTWSLAPTPSLLAPSAGIRGLVGVGTLAGPSPARALPPAGAKPGLPLKAFRGEPAISEFVWHFTSIHSSSLGFEPPMGSALQRRLGRLQPGHG